MKITRFAIRNFVGARDIDIKLTTPALLVCSGNNEGKTSIQNGIVAALTGEVSRVAYKKDFSSLVSDGTVDKSGVVIVETDCGDASFAIPSGKWANESLKIPGGAKAPLKYVLEPGLFAALDATERRRLLFTLSGAAMGVAAITERLLKRGIGKTCADETIKLLKEGGWDAASASCAEKATKAKGAWQAATGKPRWGEKLASEWTVQIPEFDQDEFNRVVADITSGKAGIDEQNQAIGEINARIKAIQGAKEAIDAIRVRAGNVPALQTRQKALAQAAKVAEDALEAAMDRVTAANQAIAKVSVPALPKGVTKGLVRLLLDQGAEIIQEFSDVAGKSEGVAGFHNSGAVARWGEFGFTSTSKSFLKNFQAGYGSQHVDATLTQERDEALKEAQKANNAVLAAHKEVESNEKALGAAVGDKEKLADLGPDHDDRTAQANLQEAQGLRKRLRESLAGLEVQNTEMRMAQNNISLLKQKLVDAASYHASIMAWDACAKALAPDGIQAEVVGEGLAPFNEGLLAISDLCGWSMVVLRPDMELLADSRLYGLLSESEKWRADAAVAIVIAQLSGIRFACFDRVDVLSPANRGVFIGLISDLIYNNLLDGAVCFATLKEAPTSLPEEFTSVFLANGKVAT